jgi:predicted DNA-binding mobile mystery protein A
VVDIEKGEMSGSITLDSLARAAHALDCELVYALVPRKPLETMVEERATEVAIRSVKAMRHTMALEDQSLDEADEQGQVKQLAKRMVERSGSRLWADE